MIGYAPTRARHLIEILRVQLKIRDKATAATVDLLRQVVASLNPDDTRRVDALRYLGTAEYEVGDEAASRATLAEARALADGAPAGRERDEILGLVAYGYAMSGKPDEAILLLKDKDYSLTALIAQAQARAGDLGAALRTFAAITELGDRENWSRAIARDLASHGEVRWALDWAEAQDTPRLEARALLGAAEGLLGDGPPKVKHP